MNLGKILFPRPVLEIRLELNGRVLCEGTTRDLPAETTIGRAEDCGWRIPPTDKTASNHHARLRCKRGKWWVEDTGSRNGMYCKGEKVSQWCLAAGDQVAIGDCVLVADRVADKDASRAAYHRLEQLNGADAGRMLELDREISIVGSAPTCDIVCDDNLVSHRHAELACKRDGSCWVKDLKSRNGTRVNRVQLKNNERMLRDGDILSVAYVDFRFWDKNTAHAPSNIRFRAMVAAMTVLVCLAGWFFWSAAHPSAELLLKRARHQAEKGHFQEALHLAEAARLARHNDVYAPQIQDLTLSIRNWQDTAMAWEAIQEHMKNGKWAWAQQGFTKVSKWDWNTDTAIEHKRRAESVERLLNTYIDMRQTLGNAHSTAEQLAEGRANWEKALADAEREPAMQASVWPVAFEAEFGGGENIQIVAKNTAYTNVWLPLRDAGGAVAAEIAAGLAAEREIRAALAGLAGADILSSPAQACREKIRVLHDADKRHREEQEADQKANGYRVLRFCTLAENEYNRVWLALDDLVAAEKTVIGNLETLAAMEPGWETRLQTRLEFPNRTDEIRFTTYRKELEAANDALCGNLQSVLRNTHLAAFQAMGMDGPEGTSAAIDRLTRQGTVQAAMRFIDWTQPPARWGLSEAPIPGCTYDEILGCYYAYEFLTDGEEKAKESLEMALGDFESKWSFCPVARKARDHYKKLKAFVDFVNADPRLKAVATRLGPLPGKRPNRLKQYYDRARGLLRERDGWLEENVEPFCKGEDRDGALARVLWLIVSPQWNAQMHDEANNIRAKLFNAFFQRAEAETGSPDYLRQCVPDKRYFTEWREHADSQASNGGVP